LITLYATLTYSKDDENLPGHERVRQAYVQKHRHGVVGPWTTFRLKPVKVGENEIDADPR
jgi:hypothetical protein